MNILDRLWVRHPVFFTTWVNSYPMLLWDFCLLPYSWIVLNFLTSNLKSPCFTVYIVNCIKYKTIIYPKWQYLLVYYLLLYCCVTFLKFRLLEFFQPVLYDLFILSIKKLNINYLKTWQQSNNQKFQKRKKRSGLAKMVYIVNCTKETIIYSKWHYLSLSIFRKLLFSATINSTRFFHPSNLTKGNEES